MSQEIEQELLDKFKGVIIPPDVTNKRAYLKFLEVDKEYRDSFHDYQTSKEDLVVRVEWAPPTLRKAIKDLPDKEQKVILDLNAKVLKLRGKRLGFKNAAYGNVYQKGDTIKRTLFERRLELITYFSRFYSIKEVHRIVTTQWRVGMSYQTLVDFFNDNLEEVKRGQEEYKKNLEEIRLVYKKNRLEELLELYNHRKEIYTTGHYGNDYKLLLLTLEQIRKEIEGDKLTVDGALKVELERTVNIHIQQEVLQELPIKSLIIALVSAKLNIDPTYLMSRLQRSYYAKFSGVLEAEQDMMTDKILYPSALVYDFDKIRLNNQSRISKEKEMKSLIPIPTERRDELLDLKSNLMRLLESKKDKIAEERGHALKNMELAESKNLDPEVKFRPGRPKGSKNKVKEESKKSKNK